jgi:hypothetical protein
MRAGSWARPRPGRHPLVMLRRIVPALLAGGALVLVACGGNVDDGKLEGQIKKQVQQNGGSVKSVDCPSGKKIKTGTTFVCTLTTPRGRTFPIRVKITSEKDGGRAEYLIPPDALTGG